jgi:hypothetical protein
VKKIAPNEVNTYDQIWQILPIGCLFTLASFYENQRSSAHVWATFFHG